MAPATPRLAELAVTPPLVASVAQVVAVAFTLAVLTNVVSWPVVKFARRTAKLPSSMMYRLPCLSTARPRGPLIVAAVPLQVAPGVVEQVVRSPSRPLL